jgi:hypothetical protein
MPAAVEYTVSFFCLVYVSLAESSSRYLFGEGSEHGNSQAPHSLSLALHILIQSKCFLFSSLARSQKHTYIYIAQKERYFYIITRAVKRLK